MRPKAVRGGNWTVTWRSALLYRSPPMSSPTSPSHGSDWNWSNGPSACVRITSFRRLPTGSRRSSPRPLRRVRSSPRARASWNAKRGAEPARGEGKEEQYDGQQDNAEVSHLASLLFQDRRGLNDVSDRGGKEGKPLHRFPGNSRVRGNVVLFEVRHGRACGHRHGGVKRDWGGDGARVRRLGRPRRPDRPEGGAAGATRRGASRQPGG